MIVSMLAGPGHRLRHLLRAAGLAKSTYYHLLSHPAAVTRPDIEPMVAEIFARTPNGCGHRQIRMCLVHEFGVRVSHKSVLKVMRRMGLECRIRRPNPYRKYSSYRDETGARVECVCSIESGPCERVDVFHVSGRFWSTSACGEKRTPARPAWTSFPS